MPQQPVDERPFALIVYRDSTYAEHKAVFQKDPATGRYFIIESSMRSMRPGTDQSWRPHNEWDTLTEYRTERKTFSPMHRANPSTWQGLVNEALHRHVTRGPSNANP